MPRPAARLREEEYRPHSHHFRPAQPGKGLAEGIPRTGPSRVPVTEMSCTTPKGGPLPFSWLKVSYHQRCEIKVWCAKCFVLHRVIVAIGLALGPLAPCSAHLCPAYPATVLQPTATERRPSRYLAIACPLFHLSQALTAFPCFPQIYYLGFCSERQKQAAPLFRSNLSLSYWNHVSPLRLSKTSYTSHFFV